MLAPTLLFGLAAAFSPLPRPYAHRVQQASSAAVTALSRYTSVRLEMPNLDGTGAFKDIQEYPCTLDIKCIGNNEGPFVADILTLCAEITGQEEADVPVRWRDKGKFRAITLTLKFENADQVYAVYAALDRDPRVRYKL